MNNCLLFVAQGFGLGRIPVAPGTFGSLLGVAWFALLLWPGSLLIFVTGTLGGLALSVWACGLAERILLKRDPSSVVLDEVATIPVAFAGWLVVHVTAHHAMPSASVFFGDKQWILSLVVLVVFRFFDIAKPSLIRQSQNLSGGWGVTADDFLAAMATAILTGSICVVFQ